MLPGSSAESICGNPEEPVSLTFIVFQAVFDFLDAVRTDRAVKFTVVAAGVGLSAAVDDITPQNVLGIISDSYCHTTGSLTHCAPIPFVIGISAFPSAVIGALGYADCQ